MTTPDAVRAAVEEERAACAAISCSQCAGRIFKRSLIDAATPRRAEQWWEQCCRKPDDCIWGGAGPCRPEVYARLRDACVCGVTSTHHTVHDLHCPAAPRRAGAEG